MSNSEITKDIRKYQKRALLLCPRCWEVSELDNKIPKYCKHCGSRELPFGIFGMPLEEQKEIALERLLK